MCKKEKEEWLKMHVTKKLSADIRSSRRRMQAGQSPSVVKSAQQTGETNQKRKPKAEHTNIKQHRYIDSGNIKLTPQ